jgi:DNA-binding PadR family transcriptional regulator
MGGRLGIGEQATPMHSSVNWALLGLVIERPSYAYELAQRFERMYDGALPLSSVSVIYNALATLCQRGLVTLTPGANETRRSRRRYEATPFGISEHAHWLIGRVSDERRRQRVLIAQLGALAHTPQLAFAALDEYERACLHELAAAPAPGANAGAGTTRLVARLIAEETRLTLAARLRWVEYARAQLHELAADGR